MKFSTQGTEKKFQRCLPRVIAITGWEVWDKRLNELARQYQESPFRREHLRKYHWIELEVARVKLRFNDLPAAHESETAFGVRAFVMVLYQVYRRATPAAKKKIRGQVLAALQSDRGFLALAFEMEIIGIILAAGGTVELHDLETAGGFDFLATSVGAEMEVECTTIGPDLGRKIRSQPMYLLGQKAHPWMASWINNNPGMTVVTIRMPDKLEKAVEIQEALVGDLRRLLSSGEPLPANREWRIDVERLPLDALKLSADMTHQEINKAIGEYRSQNGKKPISWGLIHNQPKNGALIINVESEAQDRVFEKFQRTLLEKGKQFSRNRPAFLCVRLLDWTEEELHSLAKAETDETATATGLQRIVYQVFKRRPHIHTLAFTTASLPRVSISEAPGTRTTSTQGSMAAYQFTNPKHPLAADERLSGIMEFKRKKPAA